MSNDNLRGHLDRRIPVRKREIKVSYALAEIYENYCNLCDSDRNRVESEAFHTALQGLDKETKVEIKEMLKKLDSAKYTHDLRSFGETSALELLAKLGIFFTQTNGRIR